MEVTSKLRYILVVYVLATTLMILFNSILVNKDRTLFTALTPEKSSQEEIKHPHDEPSNLFGEPAENSSGEVKYRIQFKNEGKCVGISENDTLIVSYCDPNVKQGFVYGSNSVFMLPEVGKCVCIHKNYLDQTELVLADCKQAIKIKHLNGGLIFREKGSILCVSPVEGNKPSPTPVLGATIALTPCDPRASVIVLLEEQSFLKDRQALLLPYTSSEKCDFPACGINYRPPQPKFLSPDEIERCSDISKCVTVVVKTARRPLLVLRLAKSLESTLNKNLSMIVIDDGPVSHPPEIMEKIAQFPNINYIIGDKKDLGISEGRNMGVRMVKTKYFLSFDDDLVVSEKSNITTMLEMLDKMDISLVGGKFKQNFAGFMDFQNSKETGEPVLMYYPGSCTVKSQQLISYPGCYRCELTANGFMARTQDILDVGGWSKELKILEHKDVFLRLKAAGKKVVYCQSFKIQNVHSSKGVELTDDKNSYDKKSYAALRHRVQIMTARFVNHWNIVEIIKNEDKKTWPKTWD